MLATSLVPYIDIDIHVRDVVKNMTFLGDSLKRLKAFPDEARLKAGHNFYLIQRGSPLLTSNRSRSWGQGAISPWAGE